MYVFIYTHGIGVHAKHANLDQHSTSQIISLLILETVWKQLTCVSLQSPGPGHLFCASASTRGSFSQKQLMLHCVPLHFTSIMPTFVDCHMCIPFDCIHSCIAVLPHCIVWDSSHPRSISGRERRMSLGWHSNHHKWEMNEPLPYPPLK